MPLPYEKTSQGLEIPAYYGGEEDARVMARNLRKIDKLIAGAQVGGGVSHTLTSEQILAKTLKWKGLTRTWDKPVRKWRIDATLVRQSGRSNVLQQKYITGSGVTYTPALNAAGQAVMRFANGSGAQAIVRHKLADLSQKHGCDWRIQVANITGTNATVGLEISYGSMSAADTITGLRIVIEVNPTAGTITARQLNNTTTAQTWNVVTAGLNATAFELGVIKCFSSYAIVINGVFVGGIGVGYNITEPNSDDRAMVASLYTDLPAGGSVDVLTISENASPGVGIADIRPVTRRSDGALVTDASGHVYLTTSNRLVTVGVKGDGGSSGDSFRSCTGVWRYHPDRGLGSLEMVGQIFAWRNLAGQDQDRPYHASQLMMDDIEGGWIWGAVSHADPLAGNFRFYLGRTQKDPRFGVNRVAVAVQPLPPDTSPGSAEDYAFAWDASIGRWRWAVCCNYDGRKHAMWTTRTLDGADPADFVKVNIVSTGQTWYKLADGWVCAVGESTSTGTYKLYRPDGTQVGGVSGAVNLPAVTPMSGAWPCLIPRNDGVRDRIVFLAFDEAVDVSRTLSGLTVAQVDAAAGADNGKFGYGNVIDFEG